MEWCIQFILMANERVMHLNVETLTLKSPSYNSILDRTDVDCYSPVLDCNGQLA
jgi:hypothetical protein